MRIKAILTTLLLGTSSLAAAHPYYQQQTYQRPTYNQPYYQVSPYGSVNAYRQGQNPYAANIARDEWSVLADGVSMRGGGVTVPLNGQRFEAIELQALRGGQQIDAILVDLVDGRRITVNAGRTLHVDHDPNIRVDLGQVSAGIRSVTILGRGGWGSFRLIGGNDYDNQMAQQQPSHPWWERDHRY